MDQKWAIRQRHSHLDSVLHKWRKVLIIECFWGQAVNIAKSVPHLQNVTFGGIFLNSWSIYGLSSPSIRDSQGNASQWHVNSTLSLDNNYCTLLDAKRKKHAKIPKSVSLFILTFPSFPVANDILLPSLRTSRNSSSVLVILSFCSILDQFHHGF